jgi:tight adherence protein B
MSVVLGLLLGFGLLLCAAPVLWPPSPEASVSPRAGRIRSLLDGAGLDRVPLSVFVAVSGCAGVVGGAVAEAALGVLALDAAAIALGGGLAHGGGPVSRCGPMWSTILCLQCAAALRCPTA